MSNKRYVAILLLPVGAERFPVSDEKCIYTFVTIFLRIYFCKFIKNDKILLFNKKNYFIL